MNRELGIDAMAVPRAVPKALRAMRRNNTRSIDQYLRQKLTDDAKVDRVIAVIGAGAAVAQLFLIGG